MIKEVYNEEDKDLIVQDLGIFELRGLARKLGVPSPTTKKRDELVSLILEKIKSGQISCQSGKKKGRPFKSLSAIDDIYTTITNPQNNNEYINKNQNYQAIQTNFDSSVVFNQEISNYSYDDTVELKIFEGIIRENQSGFFFYDINTFKCVFINKDIDYSINIETGDKVVVKAYEVFGKNQFNAVEIISINNISVLDYCPQIQEKGDVIISDKTLPFGNKKIYIGRRNITHGDKDLYESESELKNFINICKENNQKLILIGLNTSFENIIMLNNYKNIDKFISEYGQNDKKNFTLIFDAINYCERLSQIGENVVVGIIDIIEILNCLDRYFTGEKSESFYDRQTFVVLEKILSLGKAYQNGNSTTLLLNYNDIDKDERVLKTDIIKVCKVI